jgi:hypothetical protein
MTTAPDPFKDDDAAYVLGALGRDERNDYEAHLRTCARCSAAEAELAGLPGLLARVPALPGPDRTTEPPPETALAGLLGAVRRDRSRRRAGTALAAVAAAVLLVVGSVTVTEQLRTSPGASVPAGAPVPLNAVGDAPLQADLWLEAVSWGTRITMTCRSGGPAGAGTYSSTRNTYQLLVVPNGGAGDLPGVAQSVASWRMRPGRATVVAGSTALSPGQIAEVQLRDGDGRVLLRGTPPQ